MKKGRLFVITAPSGAGKSSLIKALLKDDPSLKLSTSYTTRSPRPGEQNGREYHFVSEPEFQRQAREGELLEWANFAGHWYGTPRDPVPVGQEHLDQADNVLSRHSGGNVAALAHQAFESPSERRFGVEVIHAVVGCE